MSYTVQIPWYATALRADDLEYAVEKLSQISLKRGGLRYDLYRSKEDRYKFTQILTFESKLEFERFWYGEECQDMRASTSGWYAIPLLYQPLEHVCSGQVDLAPTS